MRVEGVSRLWRAIEVVWCGYMYRRQYVMKDIGVSIQLNVLYKHERVIFEQDGSFLVVFQFPCLDTVSASPLCWHICNGRLNFISFKTRTASA